MATHPFAILIDGVNGGANILDDFTASTTPWVDPSTVTLTTDASGQGGNLSFDVIQIKSPASGGPWWKSGNVYDNARVRFQVSGVTTFLGYITSINAQLGDNGIGTRASVQAAAASNYLDKIIIYKGRLADISGGYDKENTVPFIYGTDGVTTDQTMMNNLVSKAQTIQGQDGTTGRAANNLIVDTSTTPAYTGSAVIVGRMKFTAAATLRSVFDSVVEAAQSVDGNQRRYWVKPSGQIAYGEISTGPAGGYGNAPFKIVTTASYSPYAQPATLAVRDLTVTLDHDQIVKKARFLLNTNWSQLDSEISGTTYQVKDPFVRTYNGATGTHNGAGISTRNGPRPEAIIQVNPTPSRPGAPHYFSLKLDSYASRYFGSNTYINRAAPVRSITFTVRGASGSTPTQRAISTVARAGTTATITTSVAHGYTTGNAVLIIFSSGPTGYAALNGTYAITVTGANTFTYTTSTSGTVTSGAAVGTVNDPNAFGYYAGYYQTGASTYALQPQWEAGQFVRIDSTDLDLAGIFRIEELQMGFEANSMIARYQITCERLPQNALNKWLKKAVG